ncbi:hypothetical protein E8L90_03275 [Brevibacillus antibioticus]|uniref:Uncharacterized protein n=1 Tax=Brevibacillus antibioticus TaxID=2570228 RepID=A0A4U2Y4F0_9BACL|nr:hypothetical protein [Brevibacillus antibioticus]TKI54542.1 hypothetical protein E8L90_03275 [Brevibacillus antibioticus]
MVSKLKHMLMLCCIVLLIYGCGTSREFLVVKYNGQGKVIASRDVKGNQPVKDEDGVSFFMMQDGQQLFIQVSGNVDVIEVTGDVQAALERLGIKDG